MRGPRPVMLTLADDEQAALTALVRRHTTPQQVALRARIVLAAAAGQANAAIARTLGTNVETVRRWRGRWRGLQAASLADLPAAERLTDAPRPGAPARITATQVCQIVELACAAPERSGRPISQWTARELADEIVARGIVARISGRHAARLLKRGICSRTAGAIG